jgi:putative transposase
MAAKVVISERQQQVLQAMVRSRSCPQGLAHRAEIILLAFAGCKNEATAERLNCERHGVGVRRRRRAFARLVVIGCLEKPAALREAIEEVLGDLPRAGRSRPERRGNWPTRRSNGASSRPSPSATSDVP